MIAALDASLRQALHLLRERLEGCPRAWLVGGSCGLLLQGVALAKPPRDIDTYANADAVGEFHERLRPFAVGDPAYSETPIYRSILGHYDVQGHALELVGGFAVETQGCEYIVDVELLQAYAPAASVGDEAIALMPLGHELLFNVLRRRPDRYEAVAAVMKANPELHLPALSELLARGRWSAEVQRAVRELLKE